MGGLLSWTDRLTRKLMVALSKSLNYSSSVYITFTSIIHFPPVGTNPGKINY